MPRKFNEPRCCLFIRTLELRSLVVVHSNFPTRAKREVEKEREEKREREDVYTHIHTQTHRRGRKIDTPSLRRIYRRRIVKRKSRIIRSNERPSAICYLFAKSLLIDCLPRQITTVSNEKTLDCASKPKTRVQRPTTPRAYIFLSFFLLCLSSYLYLYGL